jgi:hypothetical protein
VEEAIVMYRQQESVRLAHEMPSKDITLTQDETCTGGLSLVGIEPVSNSILLEQAAQGRDQDTWNTLMEQALAGLNCRADLPPHHFRGCFEKARGYSDFSCKM